MRGLDNRARDILRPPLDTLAEFGLETSNSSADEMRGRLDRWMRATNDPLLKGPVQAPQGAIINDPDQVLPHELTKIIA